MESKADFLPSTSDAELRTTPKIIQFVPEVQSTVKNTFALKTA